MKCNVLVIRFLMVALPGAAILMAVDDARAETKSETSKITLADGKLSMRAPNQWVKKKPRVRIVEYEFALPHSAADERDGRLTVMGAGGSVQANIDRWISQFSQPNVKKTAGGEVVEKMDISGQSVYYVDISGTYLDRRGPFAPATSRKNYRMLGAIIQTEKHGRYFCKCYGPVKTIQAHEDAFMEMLKSLEFEP